MGKEGGTQTAVPDRASRGTWDSQVEFVLSCLGYAVGLGNVWRFPYLCYENGGGAFLIPYVIMLVFVGVPLFFIELSVGQFSATGPMYALDAAPIFQGVGAGMIVISCISNIYYNMIIAWSLHYMFASWTKILPWGSCTNDFNTAYCYSKREAEPCEGVMNGSVWFNQTCFYPNETTELDMEWVTNQTHDRISASEEYLNLKVLDRSPTMGDEGYVKWDLVLVLLLAWIICFLCVIKGIKSSGKVVYFTATFPYVIILILLIRGVTLDGAGDGIYFYLNPDWNKLKTGKVWVDAAGQIFFSLSVGMGGLLTFASYNKFNNNVYRDTLIVSLGNCITSFVAGFAIFSILGHLAHVLNSDVKNVAKAGSALAFIAYPDVVTYLEPPQLWATLFFFMLIILGLDSQFAGIENVVTAVLDMVPKLRPYKTWVALIQCIIFFLLGLTMCTKAGQYWLDLMGYYSSGWSLVLLGLAEAIVFPWIYGAGHLKKDIELMLGFTIGWHWWFCWRFISPVLLIVILIFNIVEFTPLSVGDYLLPDWAQALGWLMAVASVGMIPIFAVIRIIRSRNDPELEGLSLSQRLLKLTQPNKRWLAIRLRKGEAVYPVNAPPAYAWHTGADHVNPGYQADTPVTATTAHANSYTNAPVTANNEKVSSYGDVGQGGPGSTQGSTILIWRL